MTFNKNSILDLVKQSLGVSFDQTAFDPDITMFINGSFGSLQQLGVGSDTGFMISDNTTLWSQYISGLKYLGMVQSYIFLRVKLLFDTPATSFAIDAIKDQITELSWRIVQSVEEINDNMVKGYLSPTVVDLDFASVILMDASQANMFYLTMTGDCVINSPVNGADGEHITLEITSNGHSVTWGSGWNFGDIGQPTLSLGGKSDTVSAYYKQDVATWRAGVTTGF